MADPPSSVMPRSPRRVGARFVAFLRADFSGVRAGFVALLISSGGDLVTGVTFATISNTLNLLPGPRRAGPGRDRHAGQRVRRPRQPPRHA